MTVIRLPFADSPSIEPDLSGAPTIDHWTLLPGGGCPTLVGAVGNAPAFVEIRAISPQKGFARLRTGGFLRLGTPAS